MSFSKPSKEQKQQIALKLDDCWAKTYLANNGQQMTGRNVFSHCQIVGHVARSLLSRMPCWLRNELFPFGSELIAAAHDIGKVSPTFQEKIRRGRGKTSNYVPNSQKGLEGINPELEKEWGGHAGVSQLAAEACLHDKYIPLILGQHHGYSPNLAGHLPHDPCFGGTPWQIQREELIHALHRSFECDWPKVTTPLQANLLAGLTTVSDWIGSGTLFDDSTDEEWLANIEVALDNAGFVFPKLRTDLSFKDVFECDPYLVQTQFIETCHGPGVYILEAPMGIGKTEAALYAAYKIMISGEATGLYFALPTQLTSDKIHERVSEFLDRIIDPSSQHRKAMLIHGNAWLKVSFMGEDGQPGGSWFQSKKRGILAPFGVGTIDQALMAVMNVKHGFVRTFGLAGKVVILDEVHTYDSYTGTILDSLINALRDLKCTVIILSATLTQERRRIFLGENPRNNHYPLISVLNKTGFAEIAVQPSVEVKTAIHFCNDDSIAIEEALSRAENGQQVLWIENTVKEAQQQYRRLAAKASEMDVDCGLLHSRFLKYDRQAVERKWVALFGKEGACERHERGRILVGTQVLEQSLDIDADFLITRMCPTDMLLQRFGRLWRHSKTIRPSMDRQEAWLLAPTLEVALEDQEKAFGASAKVYDPYILLRSLEVWGHRKSVSLPHEIRALIESTYVSRDEEGKWSLLYRDLILKREKLKSLAQVGLSRGGKTLPESKASTRCGEQESVEVLLLQDFQRVSTGCRITFLNGEKAFLPNQAAKDNQKQHRELSISLMQNTVRVPEYYAPLALPVSQLGWLKDYFYLGDPDMGESILRVAKVHSSGSIIHFEGTGNVHASKLLSYTSNLGYIVE